MGYMSWKKVDECLYGVCDFDSGVELAGDLQ